MTKQQEYIDELETKIEWLQGIVDEAIAWRKSFGHLRDVTDEGCSVATEETETELYDVVKTLEAAEAGGREEE